jgi:inhibitor of KinA
VSPDEVASLHAAAEYRVLMMGFAPGHAYMGGLDPKLTIPRRASPRAVVPAGSVAIANEQTVVYPYAISGGWNVIGRTPMTLFDASRPRPSLLWPGDRVRFRAITRAEFIEMAASQ